MKKLYRKGAVHPSPPVVSDQLSFLPAAILTLAASLSPEDREVLAYLISCSSTCNFTPAGNRRNTQKATGGGGDHPAMFNCSCFRCYMSYWVRWDNSPNRQLIHEIIDAFEDGLVNKKEKNKKSERRKNSSKGLGSVLDDESKRSEPGGSTPVKHESESVEGDSHNAAGDGGGEEDDGDEGYEKGSVRKLVSFLGERIWGVWT